ncbi:hypothetical protein A458_15745 [Stutzerimonas stutzeri CCUG 29243]|uniref:Uncharacterized protein n=1 Tax=Stutzerimonas stutzeri CCUG 29243 TaxID=1196835 RepID=I4CWB7_STUST|nr:hypothetical protein A458_15745 [Stutzerimonas stutzeri CCUG 29243]
MSDLAGAGLTFVPKTPEPLVGRSSANACSLRGNFDAQALFDMLGKKSSGEWWKTGMFMQVHLGLLAALIGRASRIPRMPRIEQPTKRSPLASRLASAALCWRRGAGRASRLLGRESSQGLELNLP